MMQKLEQPKKGYKSVKSIFGGYEEIPIDWDFITFASIAQIKRGASPRPIEDLRYFGKGRGWVRIRDVSNSYKYLEKTTDYLSELGESKSVPVNEGDLIMSIAATVGKPILLKMKACIHDGFVTFSNLSPQIDAEFLFYLLTNVENKLKALGQHGTQSNVNADIVSKITFAKPPIKEQQKIASILSNVDSLIQQTQKEIEQTQRHKKALMQKLLTKGIGHTRFKKVKWMFGKEMEIPEEWGMLHFDEFISFKSGSTPSRTNPEYFKGVIPWVTSTDLNREIISYTIEKITREAVQNTRLKILPKGTFLIALYGLEAAGTRGKCGILGIDATINQACMALTPSENVDSKYLYYYYLNFGEKIVFSVAQGTKQQNLSEDVLSFIRMPIPTKDEQRDIMCILENVDSKYSVLVQSKSKLETLKKGLMQKLLTGQLRVKI
ncbi:MAG: restriction endonuclease subunit S [Thaumarchaeota archaeon]|nr:restriction endonuclease subunit S [Nitrososphaerota archaeon]